jgi:DNA-directed RNA polymerase subunit RPC12/RpoP
MRDSVREGDMNMSSVSESDALYGCIRCSRDICNQHAVFAETEYEEPLTYCNECFDKVIERWSVIRNSLSKLIRFGRSRARAPDSLPPFIRIVKDQPCPYCGSTFPNRPKVHGGKG